MQQVIEWQADIAIIVIGSNDMGSHPNLDVKGSFFANKLMNIYNILNKNMICFMVGQGERYDGPRRDVFKEPITQGIFHRGSSQTNKSLKNNLLRKRLISWPAELRQSGEYYDGVHLRNYGPLNETILETLETLINQNLYNDALILHNQFYEMLPL